MAKAKEILIGIDLGTTVLKASAFDRQSGRALVSASGRLRPNLGNDGKRELDCAQVIHALRRAFGQIRAVLGKRWAAVSGLGLASQGGSCVLADRNTGSPLHPMILWNDMRCIPFLARVKPDATPEFWRGFSWRDQPGWGLARILWLREHKPKLLKPGTVYAGAGDWLMYQLTGVWRQDAGNALQEGCYNQGTRDIDAVPLSLVDAAPTLVSPMRQGHELHPLTALGAKLLSLQPGIPIAGPYMDHEAGYLAGVGAVPGKSRTLQLSLGTAWVGNFTMPAGSRWTSPFQLVLPSPIGLAGHQHMVCQPLLTGNVTWDWAWQTLLGPRATPQQIRKVFSRSLFPPTGLCALPWLNMPNPLFADSLGGGAFFGANPGTTREDLLRAMALAMVCELRRVLEPIIARGHIDTVVVAGGASNWQHFRQFLTAALHPLRLWVMGDEQNAGPRGALYGLRQPIIRTSSIRLPTATTELREQCMRHYEHYMGLYGRLYAHVPAGGAILFEEAN